MKKKVKSNLKFQNNFKILSSKNGGKILIILSNNECITIDALKILRIVLISLSVKRKNDNQKEAA